MRILLYDYTGEENKCVIRPVSCRITHKALSDLYAQLTCDATDYYKGSVALGDLLRLPYPCEAEELGNDFRITEISTEDDTLTLKAWHRTYDFSNAVCTRWNVNEVNLSSYVNTLNEVIRVSDKAEAGETLTADEQTLYSNKRIENSHGIHFAYFCHDDEDVRYSRTHSCGISCMGGDAIMKHLAATYAPNVIRDGNLLVLTYGTESDYLRTVYGMPDYAPIYKANTNVTGYSTENSISGYVTSIAACSTFETSADSEEKKEQFIGFVKNAAVSDAIAYRYMSVVNYTSDLQLADYENYAAYKTAVIADVTAQAQAEVNSYILEGQNVTVESIATNAVIFGGETSICADTRTRTDYRLAIQSYEYDAISRRYENIQLGRVTASLSDLATGTAGGPASAGSAGGGGGLTLAEILEALKDQYITVQGVHSTGAVTIDGRTQTKGLNVTQDTVTLHGGFISYANSQAQRELMVGNGSPQTQSLKLWDLRNGVTYSSNQAKQGGYVVLPWGMIFAWGRQTVNLTNGTGDLNMPILIGNLLNVTATNTTSNDDVFVTLGNPLNPSDSHPNGYIPLHARTVIDGDVGYYTGASITVMYQAIGY